MNEEEFYNSEVYPEKLPFLERFRCYCDFDSQIKSLWLTSYLLFTWEHDGISKWYETLEVAFYKDGSH